MTRFRCARPFPLLLAGLLACFFLALPAGADWLVPREGDPIETRDSWTVEGETVSYTDTAGETHQMPLAEVDLEASKEKTALAAMPKVILYRTAWCGYCERASKLLTSLDYPFVEKDIEKDSAAAQEYRSKAGSYQGIPVLDVDGQVIRGYQATRIHKLVTALKQREETTAASD